jgi:hypothetical protein
MSRKRAGLAALLGRTAVEEAKARIRFKVFCELLGARRTRPVCGGARAPG